MGRPQKKGMDWFPCETTFNELFQCVEEIHGNDGFVWLFKLWQNAYKSDTGCVDLSGIHEVIAAKKARISCEKQADILKTCLDLGLLFKNDNGTYTSDGILRRHIRVNKKRENDRNLIKNELSQRKQCDNVAKSTQSRVDIEKNKSNKEYSPEVINIYNLYPTIDTNNNNRSTGKGSKDKDKIARLIKDIGYEQLKTRIENYLENCKRSKEWLKNFSVLLNNLPEIVEIKNLPRKAMPCTL